MDLKKLREQLEFYFSDSNYARDKFMIARASENDGYIPISVLMTFKRLQTLEPTIDQIREAIKGSTIIEMKDESLRKIQTEEFQEYLNDKEISKRVVYMKGFDLKADLDDIKEYLAKFCKPTRITMRRSEAREFKGSCFVEFATIAEAEEAKNLQIPIQKKTDETSTTEKDTVEEAESSKRVKIEESYIEIMMKDDYFLNKKKGKGDKKDAAFSDRVKASFLPKLYKYEGGADLDIKDIKQAIPNSAFVDVSKKVIRMKFVEEWMEKDFTIKDENVVVKKMEEEEGKDYLKGITIKKTK